MPMSIPQQRHAPFSFSSQTPPPHCSVMREEDADDGASYYSHTRQRARQRQHQFGEINITPLTDIFLVLLIIMMVVAPMMDKQGLQLVVPKVSQTTEAPQTIPKIARIQVDAEGHYWHENMKMTLGMLGAWLNSHKQAYPEGVELVIHPKASHEAFMMALGRIQQEGIQRIAISPLASDPPTSDEAQTSQ
ncbi:MAG: ExbD/TolR family protein [Vampirovibrionales bacterium]